MTADLAGTIVWSTLLGLCHIFLVAGLTRLFSDGSPVVWHVTSALFLVIAWAILAWLIPAYDAWLSLSIVAVVASGWMFVFGAVQKSLSLRFLVHAHRHPGPTLRTFTEAVTRHAFEERAAILTSAGLAANSAGGYRISDSGARHARQIRRLRAAFGISTIGLYGGRREK